MSPNLIEVTDDSGQVLEDAWLARAESVHRQLRPQLPANYAQTLRDIFAGGARMVLATDGDRVCGLAVFRSYADTNSGLRLYVDDLVTDDTLRSRGVGRALLSWLEQRARTRGCTLLTLDSGTQRTRAHRFYFREGMEITSFNFKKALKP
jgi:GNAT superfamily N-acetyltransferase